MRTPAIILLLVLSLAANTRAQQTTVSSLIAQGDSAQYRMDPTGALRLYREAEARAPRNPEVLWRISKVVSDLAAAEKDEQRARAQLDRALRYARRAVSADSTNSMAQVSLAIAYGQLAVIAPAQEKLDLSKNIRAHALRALELDADNGIAMLVLGIWNREVASLSWVLKLTMRVVYGEVPEASLQESRRLLSRAVGSNPNAIMMRLEFAKTLIELDEEKQAVAQLRKALELPRRDVGDPRRIEEVRKLLADLT